MLKTKVKKKIRKIASGKPTVLKGGKSYEWPLTSH